MNPWIGVDFDGTLCFVDPNNLEEECGKPLEPMVALIKRLRKSGKDVRIFTARVSKNNFPIDHPWSDVQKSIRYQRKIVQNWCLKHIGEVLPITCEKDYYMEKLYDDRAVRVGYNTGFLLNEDNR